MPSCVINNFTCNYELHGSGEPILLLHGLGSSVFEWEHQISFLSKNYTVYALDFRGHGASERTADGYNIPQFSSDVVEFLKAQNLSEVTIIGSSMGGMVAMEFAATNPEMCRSIVVLNSLPEVRIVTFKMRMRYYQRVLLISFLGIDKLGDFLAKRLFPKKNQSELRRKFSVNFSKNDKNAYLKIIKGFVGWSIIPRLGSIKCPALIVGGDRDYTDENYKKNYTDLVPNGQLVMIADSGHASHVDQYENLNRILKSFLESTLAEAESVNVDQTTSLLS